MAKKSGINGGNEGNEVTRPTMKQNHHPPVKLAPDAVYDVAALTRGTTSWDQFNYAPELVAAAMKLANKEKCTLIEAKEIVKAFAERVVK
jgi:hypothetical protein